MKPLHLMSRRHFNRIVSNVNKIKSFSSNNLLQSNSTPTPSIAVSVEPVNCEESSSSKDNLNINNYNFNL